MFTSQTDTGTGVWWRGGREEAFCLFANCLLSGKQGNIDRTISWYLHLWSAWLLTQRVQLQRILTALTLRAARSFERQKDQYTDDDFGVRSLQWTACGFNILSKFADAVLPLAFDIVIRAWIQKPPLVCQVQTVSEIRLTRDNMKL